MRDEGFVVEAYCDGSCKGNPGPGGWGIYLCLTKRSEPIQKYVRRGYGGKQKTTNNEMEVLAMLKLLESVTYNSTVEIYSDSQYVLKSIVNGGNGRYDRFNVGWIKKWERENFVTDKGTERLYSDMWKTIKRRCDELVENNCTLNFHWVKGHSGVEGNEIVDKLAKLGCSEARMIV